MWPTQRNANKFYGNPVGSHGGVNEKWKAANLILVSLPYSFVLAWDKKKPIKKVWFHKKAAGSLVRCLSQVKDLYTPAELVSHGLNLYGGTFTYRVMKGGSRLSMHAYGCAIDIDPEHNAFGSHTWRMPGEVVDIFEGEGWTWGGRWSKPDAMHFQAAKVR